VCGAGGAGGAGAGEPGGAQGAGGGSWRGRGGGSSELGLGMEDCDFQTGLGEWEDIFTFSGMGQDDEGMMDFKDFKDFNNFKDCREVPPVITGSGGARSLSRTPEKGPAPLASESSPLDATSLEAHNKAPAAVTQQT